MQAVKSVRVLISRSTQSHAKSAASKTGHVTIAPAMTVPVRTVPVMIVPLLIVHAMTVLGATARKGIVLAPMKRVAKHLAIVMAKASAITPHARALHRAGKPALKAVPMTASRASQ